MPPDRRSVDRDRLLDCEAREIIRAPGLRPGPGQPRSAERLRADDRPDHVAVDVDVPHREPRDDALDRELDTGMDSEREPVTARGDIIEHPVELIGAPT